MSYLCYLIAYVFEAVISYIYFGNKFKKKRKKYELMFVYFFSIAIQFVISLFKIPNVNLITFIICNFLICFAAYEVNISQSIFNSVLLGTLMLITELVILYSYRFLFRVDIVAHTTNNYVLIIQLMSAKILYFTIAYSLSKLSKQEGKIPVAVLKELLLYILPIASILLLLGLIYITETTNTNDFVYVLFSITAVLLLMSNIIVFWVHESVIKAQIVNAELQLHNQKSEIETSYYNLLQSQYEKSNILIHDIKHHLLSIQELSNQYDYKRINQYINNLYEEYNIINNQTYSNNKLINAIISRYASTCRDNKIDFYCDIRDIDFAFITDNDITSILGNLLENSLESVINATQKIIELKIKPLNKNYIVISIWNTCSSPPLIKNHRIYSTKHNKEIHGFGIASVSRVAKSYGGNIDYNYDDDGMIFSVQVLLPVQNNHQ